MDFVLPRVDILPQRSGARGGKSGIKGVRLDHERAWRLLVGNCERIGPNDTFVSVYDRVRRFGPFYMEEWDTLWHDLVKNDCFDRDFRQKVQLRLQLMHGQFRLGDLSDTEEVDWWPAEASSRVLHFLRDSDMLRVRGKVQSLVNFGRHLPHCEFLNLDARRVCLSFEQFTHFSRFGPDLVLALDRLLCEPLARIDFMRDLIFLDTKMKALKIWTDTGTADLVRFLEMDTGRNWAGYLELVDGTSDGVVLMDLPRMTDAFEPSWTAVLGVLTNLTNLAPVDAVGSVDNTLLGSLQLLELENTGSSILTGFEDARKWTGNVHLQLNRRRANGYFLDYKNSWPDYKIGYELVRPLPKCDSKTVVVKPFEWAAVALMVGGLDVRMQTLLVELLGTKRLKRKPLLENALAALCDIDSMVLHIRAWIKEMPLILRIWTTDIDASADIWQDVFRALSNIEMQHIGRMLEIKIFSVGQMQLPAQKTMQRLLPLAMLELDNPHFDPTAGIVDNLYAHVVPAPKRTRTELDEFLFYTAKRLRVFEQDDGPIGDVARRALELVG